MDWRRALSVLTLIAVAVAFPGCGKRIQRLLLANEHPTVRLGPTRVVASTGHSRTYSVRWDASDLDGEVRHVLVALDPPSLDPDAAHWTRTTANPHVVTIDAGASPEAFRRFVILTVDDRGAASQPAVIALGADNIPPQVRITCPMPTAFQLQAPTTLTISWDGIDPDGVFTTRPVRYKYLLLSAASEFSIVEARQRPDSLRRYYAEHPAGPWAGWDSTSSDTTQVQFTNLTPGADYLFVVIAFDEQGDYSPVFSLDDNMLSFRARDTQFLGPRFTVAGETFEYSYVSGGYFNDASHRIRLEVPAGVPVPIRWFAIPQPGTCDLRYRWVLDPALLTDETPRSNEQTDVSHWSAWSPITMSAALGPFGSPMPPKRGTHTLYIEADDGLAKSLAILELVVVPEQATKDLLIVDDTRLKPDARVGGALQLPSGPWPTAAELDTFLFARGGVPWQSYPAGAVSVPGVFAGYAFDTLGTRGLGSGFVPLSTLVQYRHVIWYVDGVGARNTRQFDDRTSPMTALRAMGLPGRTNALATYVRLGGKVWLAGGGAGAAVSFGFNDPSNDSPLITFSSVTSSRNELGPGRFMHDIAQWRSEFRLLKPVPQILRATGRDGSRTRRRTAPCPSALMRRRLPRIPLRSRPQHVPRVASSRLEPRSNSCRGRTPSSRMSTRILM